jgi:hypothetical protein
MEDAESIGALPCASLTRHFFLEERMELWRVDEQVSLNEVALLRAFQSDSVLTAVRAAQTHEDVMKALESTPECDDALLTHLYAELDIVDKKMVQLLAFNGGLLFADGALFRLFVDKGILGIGLWFMLMCFVLAAASGLLSAILGVVWIGTAVGESKQSDHFHRLVRQNLTAPRARLERLVHLATRKAQRTARYRLSGWVAAAAFAFFAASLLLVVSSLTGRPPLP